MNALDFDQIGRIPMAGDNVAIATRRLEAGTAFVYRDRVYRLSHTVMEGHRFAISPIPAGEWLRSWQLPFGRALRDIGIGEYICNAGMLEALAHRSLDFALPGAPNFADWLQPYELDEASFRPGTQVARHTDMRHFEGYPRPGGRGTGTRNHIVLLGTTSLTGAFVRRLEAQLKGAADGRERIDGIVAVTHTEGGGQEPPNNLEYVLRTLAGFIVHPNVGAVLAVDYGMEVITNDMVRDYMRRHGYPLEHVPHRFYSIHSDFESALADGEAIVRGWLDEVNAQPREPRPASELKVALQCGGSDAFSGVAGNPLAAWVAKEVVRYGGAANLAETDELIGAEEYILANTRDRATARAFLDKIATFKEWASWHGQTAEGNPSGGNKFRGLYNIAIKSIGAARKKAPEVRLDGVLDYAQRMEEPGFYFMDSPGNDIESIAGQVATGANAIFFITGNGSVTNFPFVPTIKFVTTTGRFNLMAKDMDVNAGRYQDGVPMDDLGRETFEYLMNVAGGRRSIGEKAGHYQVQIWRNWRQKEPGHVEELSRRPRPTGTPIAVQFGRTSDARFPALVTPRGPATDQVALVVPTSLCSGQISRMIAEELNARGFANGRNVSRAVALVHTEGCGASGGENELHFKRTLVGHLLHPFVRKALLLEHGCEKIHNDAMRHELAERGIDRERFGWASVQLDGGIERVMDKVEAWFAEQIPLGEPPQVEQVGLEALSLGLTSVRQLPEPTARALAWLAGTVVGSGGTVVVPENATLLQSAAFLGELTGGLAVSPSLEYGQVAGRAGFHVMAAPTDHPVETFTGLGATGVQAMLAHVTGPPLQSHPLIPLVQATTEHRTARMFGQDLDRVLEAEQADPNAMAEDLLALVLEVAARAYAPRLWAEGNVDFQVTRGLLGLSM